MERVHSAELLTAARVADALVYVVGVTGVLAGGLLVRDGELALAILAWLLTFTGGAGLRLASWGVRALAEILDRSRRLEEDLNRRGVTRPEPGSGPGVGRDPGVGQDPGVGRSGPPDPYRRWGGWH